MTSPHMGQPGGDQRLPPGWEQAKSSAPEAPRIKQRDSQRIAEGQGRRRLAVGARLCGQASSATAASRWASTSAASADAGLPVITR